MLLFSQMGKKVKIIYFIYNKMLINDNNYLRTDLGQILLENIDNQRISYHYQCLNTTY